MKKSRMLVELLKKSLSSGVHLQILYTPYLWVNCIHSGVKLVKQKRKEGLSTPEIGGLKPQKANLEETLILYWNLDFFFCRGKY